MLSVPGISTFTVFVALGVLRVSVPLVMKWVMTMKLKDALILANEKNPPGKPSLEEKMARCPGIPRERLCYKNPRRRKFPLREYKNGSWQSY
jgi:hypothetical protein